MNIKNQQQRNQLDFKKQHTYIQKPFSNQHLLDSNHDTKPGLKKIEVKW